MTVLASLRTRSERWFVPRDLHPGAWWLWALGLAAAASRTTNPLLLLCIVLVVVHVVTARRSEAPWALAFRYYLYLGAAIVAMRVFFRIVFGGGEGGTVLLRLPEIPLPQWAAGIRLFGDVSAEALLGGLYDGMRLATMVICLGAANALANPRRLIKAMPAALYEIGTVVVVALSVFPQLAESVQRVVRARRLRGSDTRASGRRDRMRVLHTVVVPVLEDAFDRSLALAASMDSRGYGRSGSSSRASSLFAGAATVGGLLGVCVGVYATLDGTSPRWLAGPMLLGGLALAGVGFHLAGRRVGRTVYRPDRWDGPELVVVVSGLVVAAVLFVTSSYDPGMLNPDLIRLSVPVPEPLPLLAVLAGALPAHLTPLPESIHDLMAETERIEEQQRSGALLRATPADPATSDPAATEPFADPSTSEVPR